MALRHIWIFRPKPDITRISVHKDQPGQSPASLQPYSCHCAWKPSNLHKLCPCVFKRWGLKNSCALVYPVITNISLVQTKLNAICYFISQMMYSAQFRMWSSFQDVLYVCAKICAAITFQPKTSHALTNYYKRQGIEWIRSERPVRRRLYV